MFMPKKNLTAKGQNCSSGKKAKDRLTLVACTSMDGGGRETSHHWKIGETQMFKKRSQDIISARDKHRQLQGPDDIGPVQKKLVEGDQP